MHLFWHLPTSTAATYLRFSTNLANLGILRANFFSLLHQPFFSSNQSFLETASSNNLIDTALNKSQSNLITQKNFFFFENSKSFVSVLYETDITFINQWNFWNNLLKSWNTSRSGHPNVFSEKVFLKISQDSQENTCVGVSFITKLQASGSTQVFSREICEIFKNTFFNRITPMVASVSYNFENMLSKDCLLCK